MNTPPSAAAELRKRKSLFAAKLGRESPHGVCCFHSFVQCPSCIIYVHSFPWIWRRCSPLHFYTSPHQQSTCHWSPHQLLARPDLRYIYLLLSLSPLPISSFIMPPAHIGPPLSQQLPLSPISIPSSRPSLAAVLSSNAALSIPSQGFSTTAPGPDIWRRSKSSFLHSIIATSIRHFGLINFINIEIKSSV